MLAVILGGVMGVGWFCLIQARDEFETVVGGAIVVAAATGLLLV